MPPDIRFRSAPCGSLPVDRLEGLVERPAHPDDADALVRFIDMAAEGLPSLLWAGMAEPGETPHDVGRRRARREEGGFSFRNSTVICEPWPGDGGDEVIGCLVGYPLPDEPEPVDESEVPPLVLPAVRLEAMAAGTWYVNVIGVAASWRGNGLGARLIATAARKADEAGRSGVSLIVSSGNRRARAFYRREGFDEVAMMPMVKDGWDCEGTHWILCTRR